ncbi:nf-x1 finger and helicase domain [Colletotrichum incanum]|nr:nf-x1 finger and helicase domain [Colletotrichum incanum]
MAPGRGPRSSSGFTSSAPCRLWKNTGSCRFGSHCKFSHDPANGDDRQSRIKQTRSLNQTPNPERERLQTWRRLRPKPADVPLQWDRETANYFRTAISLVEEDVSLAQEVIRDMASENRLSIIRDVIEGAVNRVPQEKVLFWESRILPFFRVLLHPSVTDSVVLEQESTTLFRSLLGIDATRLHRLYSFLFELVDHWAELPFENNGSTSGMEGLALACGVLAKVVNTCTSNMVNSHFTSIVDGIQIRLEVFGNQTADFHTMQAKKYLDYVRRRLEIGQLLPDATKAPASSGSFAEFTLSQDLPGSLSQRGRRHDNDHADIADIKLMPTYGEIMSSRDEYLPAINHAQHHLQGLQGLLDRHFRMLREDTLHDLRNAIRTIVESKVKVRELRTKIVPYERVIAVDVAFGKWSGLEFIVRIDQPRAARSLDKMGRAAWWAQNKSLMDGSLVCTVDEIGNIFFFQVSRSTIRDAENEPPQEEAGKTQQGQRHSLPDNQNNAYVHLHLVDTSAEEVKRSLLWFKTMGAWQYRRLFEFPSILLPAFAPPLKSLQKMSQKLDLPFQDLLTLREGDRPAEVAPPLYSMRPGFSFDLSCLSNDGTELSYTPGEAINPLELSQHSSLDLTQSEAILNSLRRSFALIQGPPGTGKSYTGEALIRVLLANKSKARLGPIMCVCYTNHALDQLLEHLLDGGVQNIVRIGSRSKSERLDSVNLREVVKCMARTKMEGKSLHESIDTLDNDTAYIRRKLSTYKFLNHNEKIRHFLAEHHPSQHNQLFGTELESEEGWQRVSHSRKKAVDEWLSGGSTAKNTRSLSDLSHLRLSELSHQERIVLYQDWLYRALQGELDKLTVSHDSYEQHKERNNRIRSSIDLRCLQQANIIGATTTGLATNLDLLRRVQGKVLLCEEAGEVLEAHLLTALLPTVEHAILIGDHLQLRPQIQDWSLQRANPAGIKYSLDVSLFERLVQPPLNIPGLPLSILDTQRRMHPSISKLVRSTLYPSLSNSDGVREYPNVCGMAKRLFWLHHESPESGRASDQESIETSYSNDFEIEMVSALVSHLLRQGVYKSGEIAVLTPYLGQLNKLRQKLGSIMQIIVNDRDMDELDEMDSSKASPQEIPQAKAAKATALHEIRAATVDNFQGEEANIIIVSLVRSNNEKRCGFLSTSNRINVLLSRAKHGMYVIGNSNTSSHVPMWAQVIEILQNDGNFGKEVELQCPRHLETRSLVSHPEQFIEFSPDGGCNLRCDQRLACGHSCTGPCHSGFLHNAVKCLEDCPRPKERCEHPCRKHCGEPCDKLCKEVLRGVGLKLPCGHTIDTIECCRAQDPSSITCVVQVDRQVPGCEHIVKTAINAKQSVVSRGLAVTRARCDVRLAVRERMGKWSRKITKRADNHAGDPLQHAAIAAEKLVMAIWVAQLAALRVRMMREGVPRAMCSLRRGDVFILLSALQVQNAVRFSLGDGEFDPQLTLVIDVQRHATGFLARSGPSVCGERCPNERYCQVCATDDVKERIVDYYEMGLYSSIDLDEVPCIFPQCGHFLTCATMDGQMGLKDHYEMSPEEVPVALKTGSHPFSTTEIKMCPECRGSLRNISRYGRIVRRGVLDESTKKFISWSQGKWQELMKTFLNAQDALQGTNGAGFVLPAGHPGGVDLRGPRQDQISQLFKLTGANRHKSLERLRSQISNFFASVRREEQPYQRVANLVWHANKRCKTSDFSFDESAIQMGGLLQATGLLLRCDLLLISDYIGLCRASKENTAARTVKVEVAPYIWDCETLIQMAHTRKFCRLEVEGHVFLVMFCSFAAPDDVMPTGPASADGDVPGEGKIRDLGDHHLQLAKEILRQNPSTAALGPELETAERMLHGGVSYNEVSVDELRGVYTAMSRELRGTGHWYTCRNGHPFTIGECGMPMQLTRCSECGAPVGGQHHTSAEGVRHATEIEELAGGIERVEL